MKNYVWKIGLVVCALFAAPHALSAQVQYNSFTGTYVGAPAPNPYMPVSGEVNTMHNPYTGTTTATATGVNPYTGRTATGSSSYNPYTGTASHSGTVSNPYTGQSASYSRTVHR